MSFCVLSCSVMSDSLRPHGLQPIRLLCPWDFPGKSIGVGCHCLLHPLVLLVTKTPRMASNSALWALTLRQVWKHGKRDIAVRVIQGWLRIILCNLSWLVGNLCTLWTSLVAQMVKRLSTMRETRVQSLGRKIPWRRKWQSTPVLLPGKSHGQRSLVGYRPWGHKESDMTERLHFHFTLSCHLISD